MQLIWLQKFEIILIILEWFHIFVKPYYFKTILCWFGAKETFHIIITLYKKKNLPDPKLLNRSLFMQYKLYNAKQFKHVSATKWCELKERTCCHVPSVNPYKHIASLKIFASSWFGWDKLTNETTFEPRSSTVFQVGSLSSKLKFKGPVWVEWPIEERRVAHQWEMQMVRSSTVQRFSSKIIIIPNVWGPVKLDIIGQ